MLTILAASRQIVLAHSPLKVAESAAIPLARAAQSGMLKHDSKTAVSVRGAAENAI